MEHATSCAEKRNQLAPDAGTRRGMSSGASANSHACATGRVAHCGVCGDFPFDLFVDQFDPAHGQKSAFTRAGLLAYRKRVGTQKFVAMSEELEQEELKSKPWHKSHKPQKTTSNTLQ